MRSRTLRQFREAFPPSCVLGYTQSDLNKYFKAVEGKEHPLWRQLLGQTQPICDGRLYDYDANNYRPTKCHLEPHGIVAYVTDVQEWHEGRPADG